MFDLMMLLVDDPGICNADINYIFGSHGGTVEVDQHVTVVCHQCWHCSSWWLQGSSFLPSSWCHCSIYSKDMGSTLLSVDRVIIYQDPFITGNIAACTTRNSLPLHLLDGHEHRIAYPRLLPCTCSSCPWGTAPSPHCWRICQQKWLLWWWRTWCYPR